MEKSDLTTNHGGNMKGSKKPAATKKPMPKKK
jgi:hypothetical protein